MCVAFIVRSLLCSIALFAVLVSASVVAAQEVHWNPPAQVGLGQVSKIELVFDGCSPEGDVAWPVPLELELLGEPTESRVFSMINFKSRSTVTLGFPVRARRSGSAILPSFTVETDEGPMLVAARRVAVGVATVPGARGQASQPLAEVAGATLELSNDRPFVGEVVDMIFQVGVDARRNASLGGLLRWDPDPMLVETWGQPEQTRFDRRNGVRMYSRGTFPDAGDFELSSASQDVNIDFSEGRVGLFRNRRMRTITVDTEPVPVHVRRLPMPAPPGFSGAVGRFSLESQLVPSNARVGEPLTWSLVLSGEGNWPAGVGLPPRAVPEDIQVIRPRSTREFEDGALFEGRVSEDLVLIPTRPGHLALAPVRFVFFDPEREHYETIEVTPSPVVVAPAQGTDRVAVPRGPVLPTTTQAAIPAPGATAAVEPEVSLLPGSRQEPRLPRAPAEGDAVDPRFDAAPWTDAQWFSLLAAGAIPVLILAVALARRRAIRFDSLAPRRAALVEAREIASRIAAETSPKMGEPGGSTLLAWQRSLAHVLGCPGAAPTSATLDVAAWGERDAAVMGADADVLRTLWREADDAIHVQGGRLPANWAERAQSALSKLEIQSVPWSSALRMQHLWPALVLLCVIGLPAADAQAERPGLAEYAAGDFEAAAVVFAARAEAEPLDWKARSDLGLALLQQGDIEAALAETASAFVLKPRDEALRWNLAVASRRAGWIDPALRDLAWGRGRFAVARQATPGEWQAGAAIALLAGWCALAWATVSRHRGRPIRGAIIGMVIAVVVAGTAAWMAVSWGAFSDRSVAFVRRPASLQSLPSEVADEQVEVALEAGRVVVVERAFLGWLRVRLANGDLGWVRSDVLSLVYRAPPAPGDAWPDPPRADVSFP